MGCSHSKDEPDAIVPIDQDVSAYEMQGIHGGISEIVPIEHSEQQDGKVHAGVEEPLSILDQVARLGGYADTEAFVDALIKHIRENYNNAIGHNIRGTYGEVLNHMKYPTVASYSIHLKKNRVKLNDFVLFAVFLDIAVHVHRIDRARNEAVLVFSLNAKSNEEQTCFHVTAIDDFLFTHMNTNPLVTADEARLRDAVAVDSARLKRALGDASAEPDLFTKNNPYALQGALGHPEVNDVTFEGRKKPGIRHQVGQRARVILSKKRVVA